MPVRIPSITNKSERPEGALPRNLQFVVVGGIAAVILIATFWSGNKPAKPEQRGPVAGPAANQVESFRLALEKERRDEAAANVDRLSSLAHAANGVQASTFRTPSGETDPRAERSYQASALTATAPASNYAVRITPSAATVTAPPDLMTQVAIAPSSGQPALAAGPDAQQEKPAPIATVGTNNGQPGRPDAKQIGAGGFKESGRRLPAREGELFRLYEETLVQAKLSNRLDGLFTGPVNCTVSAPVLAEDKSVMLIPAGARFLGKASRVESENQTRLAVTFKRLILPNGYSVDLEAAPGLDDQGETGLKGKVDNHNIRKFGLSGAVGLLGGLALYSGLASPYAAGVANSTGGSATNILNHALNAVPTITVPEGHPVNVYLPGDLLLPPYRP